MTINGDFAPVASYLLAFSSCLAESCLLMLFIQRLANCWPAMRGPTHFFSILQRRLVIQLIPLLSSGILHAHCIHPPRLGRIPPSAFITSHFRNAVFDMPRSGPSVVTCETGTVYSEGEHHDLHRCGSFNFFSDSTKQTTSCKVGRGSALKGCAPKNR